MAENDTRVDSLEDEVKVLKGEVRRTLVDLRALLMREDSPLNETSLGRRSAPVDLDPNEGSPQTRTEVTETLRQVPVESAGSGVQNRPVQEPAAPAPSPPQPAYPGQGFGNFAPPFGGVGPGGVVPQMGPQPGAGWPAPQVAQAPPPPPQASSGLESAMAERERRMAEQEQRMAEQERRIADQERNLSKSASAQSARDRDPPDATRMQEMPPQPKQPASSGSERERPPDERGMEEMPSQPKQPASSWSERERPSPEVDEEVGGMEQQEPRKRPSARVQSQGHDLIEPQNPERTRRPSGADPRRETENEELEPVTVRRSTGLHQRVEPDDEPEELNRDFSLAPATGQREELPVYYEQDEEQDNPPPRLQHQEQDWDDAQDSDRPSRRPAKPAAQHQKARSGNGHDPHAVNNGNRPLNRNGGGSRVYDEYIELLSETEESHVGSDEAFPTAPMDINLVASLVRWASIAKQRVGEDRLHDILELYLQSGHAAPGLREVLTRISGMADGMTAETNQTAQECVDLISHLHGILTGALTIVRVPWVKMPV